MSKINAVAGDPRAFHVAKLLRLIPDTWTEYDHTVLSELDEQALVGLVAAGMVEKRAALRLQLFGHPNAVEATITFTGEGGFRESMEPVVARVWSEWREVYDRRQASDLKGAPAFHCEQVGRVQWRLTAEGVLARADLAGGRADAVFDFVLKRGIFGWRLPDGRAFERPPLPGRGRAERMTLVRIDGGPVAVNVANWAEGAAAIAAEFERLRAAAPPADPRGTDDKRNAQGPADPYHSVREFVTLWKVKGDESHVLQALCDNGGRVRLIDLGQVAELGWGEDLDANARKFDAAKRRIQDQKDPVTGGFTEKSAAWRATGWRLRRFDNSAILERLRPADPARP